MGLEKNQQYVGKTITEIAQMQGKDPYDCACDLLIEENCNVTMVIFITDERDILNILRYPYSSVISDSIYPKSGIPHPRLYGAFPKVLSEYVRDRKLLELPAVIRKMTSEPAKLYRIGKKGLLREGYDAEMCIRDRNIVVHGKHQALFAAVHRHFPYKLDIMGASLRFQALKIQVKAIKAVGVRLCHKVFNELFPDRG